MTTSLRIAIIGGGAAGYFAAIEAKRCAPDAEITIFEKNSTMLAKVAITGGGRCNLTNSFVQISDAKQAYPRGHKLMKRLLKHFSHTDVYDWFEREGVALVTQDDECVFPASQDSQTVISCLTGLAMRLGVRQQCGHSVMDIRRNADDTLHLCFANGREADFDRVAITTGGAPKGEGLQVFARLGHKIEQPVPSLFTFNVADADFLALMGAVVDPVVTSIPGTKFRAEGALLVTHWGMSGPAVLKLSSHAARFLSENNYHTQVAVNWTGITHSSATSEEVAAIVAANAQKQLASMRPFNLPSRLWLYILAKSGLQQQKRWGELGKKGISRLVETLTNDIHTISGKGRFRDEFVTCGGVSLSSVDMNTLESRVCPHLFFAGEVLDVDAITGGFNLQAAWTMGFVVGRNVVR
ncbi:MAG: aminoacetone oxidase family FAD-binding enzyme [Prevotellaceae bacterium]|nr:aminoacetone oxidase family FAD-binding enzyme [Prevotellaceae bacterium]